MGRLSDARKKAKAKQGPATGSQGEEIVRTEPATETASAEMAVDDVVVDAPEPPAAAKARRSGVKLPSSGLAEDLLAAHEPAPEPAPKSAKGRTVLPSSGLADDIFGVPAAPPETKAPGLTQSSGLADEILGSAASESLADAILNGIDAEPQAGAAPPGDDLLAAMSGESLAAAPSEAPLEQGFEAGVLDVLLDTPRHAPRSLPSSGLAEDILPTKPQARTPLALEEIHEFESFFEDERHEIEQLHLVLFRVATEQFAVEIDRVHEVIRVPSITRVPHLAAHIRGVVNLRGRIVPVMDLRLLMNLPPRPVDRMSRIMVLDLAKKQIGVLVDLVSEVLHVSVADVEPPPEEMRVIDRNLVTAVARAEKRMIFILDMDKVLALK